MTRLFVATDVPARVELKDEDTRQRAEVLCVETPCVAIVPHGNHELFFRGVADRDRQSSAHVTLNSHTEVLNHTLGREADRARFSTGVVFVVLGGVAVVAGEMMTFGSVLDGIGHIGDPSYRSDDHQGATAAIVGGLGAAAVGCIFIGTSSMTEQPGSSMQWTPRGQARPVGGAVGWRF
jgi:hypothetical protein